MKPFVFCYGDHWKMVSEGIPDYIWLFRDPVGFSLHVWGTYKGSHKSLSLLGTCLYFSIRNLQAFWILAQKNI